MDSALKPCPFCGAGAHFESDADGRVWVECESCGMASNRSASLMDDFIPPLAETWNRRALPATAAGEPELPEPDSYCTHADSHEYDVWSEASMRAYGQAMAEHARRVAMEEAALIVDSEEDNAREERYHPGLVGALSACAAAIRAAAPPQGRTT